MHSKTLSVGGLSCTGCETTVENALATIDGVENVEADHETGTVTLDADESISDASIRAAVEDAGYELVGQ